MKTIWMNQRKPAPMETSSDQGLGSLMGRGSFLVLPFSVALSS
jgi:hypothetical protein